MIIKNFNCDKCNKITVCKYMESMKEFHKDILNTYEQYPINHDFEYIPILSFKIDCLEYVPGCRVNIK